MTPLDQAQSFVLSNVNPLDVVALRVDVDAVGAVLAADVVSAERVPPFDNSAVDGYAVRAADLSDWRAGADGIELAVVAEVAAGSATERVLQAHEAIRIMTGAPIPTGADAVAMVEDTTRLDGGERVAVAARPASGDAVRRAGSDVEIGDLLFRAGTVITPTVVGVLASVNASTVRVVRRARVAVLATGDELVTDGGQLGPGQIRESNLSMLDAMLRAAGCDVRNLGVVPDDEAELERVLVAASADCDAIVTSGGVSMGDYDIVKAVLAKIADMHWMQVAIKPAKPFAFGRLGPTPIFGLPGNPVSSFVSFEMFARPALRRMMGHPRLARPSVIAIADAPLDRRPDGKTHLVRVNVTFSDDGRVHARPVSAQGSHQLAATALANAIAIVPDGDGVPIGGEVAVLLLFADLDPAGDSPR